MEDFKYKLYQTSDAGVKAGLLAEPTKFLKATFRDAADAKAFLGYLQANDSLHTYEVIKDVPVKK